MTIGYGSIVGAQSVVTHDVPPMTVVNDVTTEVRPEGYTVYTLTGVPMLTDAESTESLSPGLYIVNGKKIYLNQ